MFTDLIIKSEKFVGSQLPSNKEILSVFDAASQKMKISCSICCKLLRTIGNSIPTVIKMFFKNVIKLTIEV